jgi:hypothetical protein
LNLAPDWSYQDLAITGSGGNALGTSGSGGLLLRVTASGNTNYQFLYAEDGFFAVDSTFTGGPYVFYLADFPWVVVKGCTLSRTSSGQHTIRVDGTASSRALFQNNQILGPGNQTSLTIRGNTQWVLVQDNFFNQQSGVQPAAAGNNELQQFVVWERNIFDATNTGIEWGQRFIGHNMVVRNNVTYNNSSWHFKAESQSPIVTQNIWFLNNTGFNPSKTGGIGVVCGGSGCVSKNNLFYSTQRVTSCFEGGTRANNWCMTDNVCLDPVTGNSGCYDPNFESTNPVSPDFVRPGAGTRGIDAGDPTVPVWNDYDNADRATVDVGAVER